VPSILSNFGHKISLGWQQMLGGIGIASIRIFLVLVWITAVAAIATVVLYKFRFKVAFAIVASFGLISLALTAWAYFSIWGFVWFR
jgi:hypothetical protein